MSFNFFPKNVIKGKNSDGKSFEAYEYDFDTFATLQVISLVSYLLVGGFFCAIASPIILVILLVHFTGRFNILYLSVPILSGYFIYDCANGWVVSLLLNFFIDEKSLLFLASMHIACIVVISFMTIFGKFLYNYIVNKTEDVAERYVYLTIIMVFVFAISWVVARENVSVEWLGLTRIHRELGHI